MRPQFDARTRRSLIAAAAVLSIWLTIVAAPAATHADSQGAAIPFSLETHQLRAGSTLHVRGRLATERADTGLTLLFRPRRANAWMPVAATTVGRDGRFEFATRLFRSGALQVQRTEARAAAEAATATQTVAPAPVGVPVVVTGALTAPTRRLDVVAHGALVVRGALRPGLVGRTVALQVATHAGWRSVTRARTDRFGRFALRVARLRPGSAPARLRFAGDRTNAGATLALGRANVYRTAVASWYGPGFYGRLLGCGGRLGTAQLGVAHKTLPCGTKVTVRYRGRSIGVRVIDRGPYIAGREFDLTAATARALRFSGFGPVLVTQ